MEKSVIKSYKTYLIVFYTSIALALTSCGGTNDPFNINFFSVEDDVALGQQFNQELQQSGEVKILNNPTVTNYVQGIVDNILAAPGVKYEDVFPYTVYIVDDPNTVNAFALPGGYIYVYTGLLKFLDNEASLAGVLAHEIAHSEERHATERISKQYGMSVLLGLVLGENPSALEQIAGELLGGLTLLANSRADEAESDLRSFQYLQSSMYYPGAISYFFQKIDDNRQASWLEKWLLTHPTPKERLDEINQMVSNAKLPAPSEQNLFTNRYRQMVGQL